MKRFVHFLVVAVLVFLPLCAEAQQGSQEEAERVEREFIEFQKRWVESLRKHGEYGPGNMEIEEVNQETCRFLASYRLLNDPTRFEIKYTGVEGCEYVGKLYYDETVWRCGGMTPTEASEGDFKCAVRREITEIFCYQGNMWAP